MQQSQALGPVRFLGVAASVLGLIAGLNFVVDPLQIFHSTWLPPARYSSNPRIGDVSLIRSQDFDTVYIGTSYSYHFRQDEIDSILGVKSVNLTMSGGTSKEEALVISVALERRHPKRVIWQMDDWMFRNSEEVDKYLPVDLYRITPKGIAGYLFNLNNAMESLWIVLRLWRRMERPAHAFNIITGYPTFNDTSVIDLHAFPAREVPSSVFTAAHAKRAFELSLKSPGQVSSGLDFEAMVRNFDCDALRLLEDNPDTPFVVYFPPSSILNWVAMREVAPQALQAVYRFNEYQLQRLSLLPNVTVYDFRDIEEMTHDLNNYRDTIHHSLEVNRRILTSIANGEHRVDRANPSVSVRNLMHQVARYAVGQAASE
jgi:hypothetical protein